MHSPIPRPTCATQPRQRRSTAARVCRPAASLLLLAVAGCAKAVVVVEPLALPKVASALMVAPGLPRCALPARPDYDPREVLAYAHCWQSAYHAAAGRLTGLQSAVAVREKAIAKAVAAKSS